MIDYNFFLESKFAEFNKWRHQYVRLSDVPNEIQIEDCFSFRASKQGRNKGIAMGKTIPFSPLFHICRQSRLDTYIRVNITCLPAPTRYTTNIFWFRTHLGTLHVCHRSNFMDWSNLLHVMRKQFFSVPLSATFHNYGCIKTSIGNICEFFSLLRNRKNIVIIKWFVTYKGKRINA